MVVTMTTIKQSAIQFNSREICDILFKKQVYNKYVYTKKYGRKKYFLVYV